MGFAHFNESGDLISWLETSATPGRLSISNIMSNNRNSCDRRTLPRHGITATEEREEILLSSPFAVCAGSLSANTFPFALMAVPCRCSVVVIGRVLPWES